VNQDEMIAALIAVNILCVGFCVWDYEKKGNTMEVKYDNSAKEARKVALVIGLQIVTLFVLGMIYQYWRVD
jgi:hypothetical protein